MICYQIFLVNIYIYIQIHAKRRRISQMNVYLKSTNKSKASIQHLIKKKDTPSILYVHVHITYII